MLSLEQFEQILSNSFEFKDDYEYLQDIKDEEQIDLKEHSFFPYENTTSWIEISICTKEVFEDIIRECSATYRNENINAMIEDYFDDYQFDQDLYKEAFTSGEYDGLAKEVITSVADITKMDLVKVDNVEYVIFES